MGPQNPLLINKAPTLGCKPQPLALIRSRAPLRAAEKLRRLWLLNATQPASARQCSSPSRKRRGGSGGRGGGGRGGGRPEWGEREENRLESAKMDWNEGQGQVKPAGAGGRKCDQKTHLVYNLQDAKACGLGEVFKSISGGSFQYTYRYEYLPRSGSIYRPRFKTVIKTLEVRVLTSLLLALSRFPQKALTPIEPLNPKPSKPYSPKP